MKTEKFVANFENNSRGYSQHARPQKKENANRLDQEEENDDQNGTTYLDSVHGHIVLPKYLV